MDLTQPKTVRDREGYSDHQVGGHSGIMIFEGERLLKRSKPNEIKFYKWLKLQNGPLYSDLKRLVPTFYGVERRDGHEYIILENLVTGYDHPNMMDCKLGRITWTSYHSEEVIRRRKIKYRMTTTDTLGFRISGILINDSLGNKLEHLVKNEAYTSINNDNINEFFRKIVTVDGRLQHDAVEKFIDETERIRRWFERNYEKSFKASSILYINGKNGKAQCRYIDFAHVEDLAEGTDGNVIEGLESIIKIWRRLLEA